MQELHLHLVDEQATNELAQDLALTLKKGDSILLSGDLGVGKSTFARALIRFLANEPDLEVPSPTYTLVQPYDVEPAISHYDFYRLGSPEEVEELGLAHALEEGVAIIEWPQNAEGQLDENALVLHFEDDAKNPDSRTVTIGLTEDFAKRVQRSLLIRNFLNDSSFGGIERRHLMGDASARSYEQFTYKGEQKLLMNSPKQPDGPIVRDGKPYSQIAHLAEEVAPFVAIDEALIKAGFTAPAILARDLDEGLLITSFLGSEAIIDDNRNPIEERYIASVEMLAEFHQEDWPSTISLSEGIAHQVPVYDHAAMMIEAELMLDWYAEAKLGKKPSTEQRQEFKTIWTELFNIVDRKEKSLVLRDFHSPNILWCGDKNGSSRIGLIDFQDAVIGPAAYDVASLAQDARVDISPDLENRLINHYIDKRNSLSKPFNEAEFRDSYAIMAAQRATKILGIFIRLSKRDKKDAYLQHLPRMEAYLNISLKNPLLTNYSNWIDSFVTNEADTTKTIRK